MKRKLQKLLWIIIVVLTITNMLCTTISNATVAVSEPETTIETLENEEENSLLEGLFGALGTVVDGVVGIISKVIQIPLLLIGMALQGLLTGIASLEGSHIVGLITPDDIFFNRVGLTDINFLT